MIVSVSNYFLTKQEEGRKSREFQELEKIMASELSPALPVTPSTLSVSRGMVRRRGKVGVIASVLVILLATTIGGLWLIPWQQSVVGTGEVIIFNPMQRPQNIEAQIPAVLVDWFVQEGDTVKKGEKIAQIEDIDSKFLDPNQAKRFQEQRQALQERLKAAQERSANLKAQIVALTSSQSAAVPTADERRKQARDRLKAAEQVVIASTQSLNVAQQVASQAAEERFQQAQERIRQARQALIAAVENARIETLNLARIESLADKGLRSEREREQAQNSQKRTATEVERAKQSLEIAKRDVSVGALEQGRARLQVTSAQADLSRAKASLEEVRRGTNVGDLDFDKVKADTAATISSAKASLSSVDETIAGINNDLIKLQVESGNLDRRREQQFVLAPSAGRVVRLMKAGAGETVKSGDVLAVLAPDTQEQMVELFVTDNDAPFVFGGAPVRLQFAGWPALQWVGLGPAAAQGTFAGRVKLVDAIDDGKNRYRVVIEPDYKAIKSGEEPAWPTPNNRKPGEALTLRPGAEASGWIMLNRVSLGFELWRQLNSFPPSINSKVMKDKSGSDKQDGLSESDDKEEKKPKRKVKIK